MAQIDLGRTGADAAAVRRRAGVAAGVELRVQGLAAAGQLLQEIADRNQAAVLDLLARDVEHRRLAYHLRFADVRSDHLDAIEIGRLLLRHARTAMASQRDRQGDRRAAETVRKTAAGAMVVFHLFEVPGDEGSFREWRSAMRGSEPRVAQEKATVRTQELSRV